MPVVLICKSGITDSAAGRFLMELSQHFTPKERAGLNYLPLCILSSFVNSYGKNDIKKRGTVSYPDSRYLHNLSNKIGQSTPIAQTVTYFNLLDW